MKRDDWLAYRKSRNQVATEMRETIQDYYRRLIDETIRKDVQSH